MLRRRGIAFKLSLLIVAGALAVFAALFGYNYRVTRRLIERQAEENAGNLTRATVYRVESVLAAVEKVPLNLASTLEYASYTREDLIQLLRLAVLKNPEVHGAAVAFAPHAFAEGEEYFAPYVYREGGETRLIHLGGPQYRYFLQDWYQLPKEMNQALWSEPYFDAGGGGVVMSTYSVPFYLQTGDERIFRGVVTADVSLDWLESIVSSVRILDSGYAFLLSKNGMVVTHPSSDLIMNETIFSIAEARHDRRLRDIGRAMVAGESGFVPSRCLTGAQKCWLAYAPVPSSGWVLGALLPQKEMLADVTRLNRLAAALAAAAGLFLLAIVALVARSITRPLVALAAASEEIARGNLESPLPPVRSQDEVGRLTATFARMQSELRRSIGELAEYSRTLEQKVEERTHELREKNTALEETLHRLRQTQEQLVAQEKLASLGALTAGIAHEIKNPLNFVNNFAELSVELIEELRRERQSRRGVLPAESVGEVEGLLADLEQNVGKIREHGQRADRIVANMLQHSRGVSGEKRPTDLNQLLDEYVGLAYHGVRAQDPSFNTAFETLYDPVLAPVPVIAEDLSRAFLNLLNNACYAVREKQRRGVPGYAPVIRVQTRDRGDRVEIRIRDNGTGIPAASREKIFHPFFTTKPAGQGTGLGLSISHDVVVQEHGGELTFDSLEGEYTEFVISLPKKERR